MSPSQGQEGRRLRRLAKALADLGAGRDGLEVTLVIEDPHRPGMAFGRRGRVRKANGGSKVTLEGADSVIDLRDVERVEIVGGMRARRERVAVDASIRARSDAEKEERSHFG